MFTVGAMSEDVSASASLPQGQERNGVAAAASPAKRAPGVFKLETARVDPALEGRRLAAHWQRIVAMAIDLALVSLISVLTGPVLALGMGATILSDRKSTRLHSSH